MNAPKPCPCESPCCQCRHVAMKQNPDLMAREADFVGVQHDEGREYLVLWNCRKCLSTLAVKTQGKEAA